MRIYTEEKIKTTPTVSATSTPVTTAGHHHSLQNGFVNGNNHHHHLSPISPISSTSSNCSTTSSIESSNSSNSNGSNNNKNSSNPTFEIQNGASINRLSIPMVFNKNNRTNISMYKFVKTKGKQARKECYNNNNHNGVGFRVTGSNQQFHFDNNDYVLKPPIYVTSNHNFYKKRISAFDKIQEEIKEMKLREDELRCQRIRGISYPNLNSICDEDFNSDDQTIESSEENKDSFHSRCSSNPDLLNTSNNGNGRADLLTIEIDQQSQQSTSPTLDESDCGLRIGGPRRKIPLIAVWEQKIQEKNKLE